MGCTKVSSNEIQNSSKSQHCCPKAIAITALALGIILGTLAALGYFKQLPFSLPPVAIYSTAGCALVSLIASAAIALKLACPTNESTETSQPEITERPSVTSQPEVSEGSFETIPQLFRDVVATDPTKKWYGVARGRGYAYDGNDFKWDPTVEEVIQSNLWLTREQETSYRDIPDNYRFLRENEFVLAHIADEGGYRGYAKSLATHYFTEDEGRTNASSQGLTEVSNEQLQARCWFDTCVEKTALEPSKSYVHKLGENCSVIIKRENNEKPVLFETIYTYQNTAKSKAKKRQVRLGKSVLSSHSALIMWCQKEMEDNAAQVFRSSRGHYTLLDKNIGYPIIFSTKEEACSAKHENSDLDESESLIGAFIDNMIGYIYSQKREQDEVHVEYCGVNITYTPDGCAFSRGSEGSVGSEIPVDKVLKRQERYHSIFSFLEHSLNKDEGYALGSKFFKWENNHLVCKTYEAKKYQSIDIQTLFSRMNADKAKTYFRQLKPGIDEPSLESFKDWLLSIKNQPGSTTNPLTIASRDYTLQYTPKDCFFRITRN